MNELSNDANYNELKAEIRALRAQVEDLNGRLKSIGFDGPGARRRMFSRVPDSRWLLAAGLLVLVGAVAQTSSDPAIKVDTKGVAINRPLLANNSDIYFMNANHHPEASGRLGDAVGQAQITNVVDYKALMIFGRRNLETPEGRVIRMFDWVGIGGKGYDDGPRAALDVRGKVMAENLDVTGSIAGTSLDVKTGNISGGTIQAGNSEVYFTKTNHDYAATGSVAGNAAIENAQNYHALMILGRQEGAQRTVRVWDKLGIAGAENSTVDAALDVKGEIRGKLWQSGEYSWSVGSVPTKMTATNRSICFLTRVSGWFNGRDEFVQITESGGFWMLSGSKNLSSGTSKARCIGAPDNSW